MKRVGVYCGFGWRDPHRNLMVRRRCFGAPPHFPSACKVVVGPPNGRGLIFTFEPINDDQGRRMGRANGDGRLAGRRWRNPSAACAGGDGFLEELSLILRTLPGYAPGIDGLFSEK